MRRLLCVFALATVLPFAQPAFAQSAGPIESVDIEGRLIDDKDKLLRFLGLEPGVPFDAKLQQRIADDLSRQLGYHLVEARIDTGDKGVKLHLVVKPARVVRALRVHGNWPLFDDEIIRHLTLRSGTRLVADEQLAQYLLDEAERVRKFLEKDGYFDAQVQIVPRQGPREEWVDLDVNITLGSWYKLRSVLLEGGGALSRSEVFDQFDHCCFRWGRFSQSRMREDARSTEKKLRDKGYPAARVSPELDLATGVDKSTHEITLPVRVTEKKRVEVRFVGNRSISDKELRQQLTIFSSGAYDEIELRKSAGEIQRDYQRHGFFEAKVGFDKRRLSDDVEEVSYLITEGPELRVRGVDVVSESGEALSFGSDEVLKVSGVETRTYPKLGVVGLGEGGYVTRLQLDQDADRIATYYKTRGFPDVKVRPEVAKDPDSFGSLGALGAETAGAVENKNDLYVRFFVDEGRQELVESVTINFVPPGRPHKKTDRDIRKVLRLVEGKPYTAQALLDDRGRLLELYRASAHPYIVAAMDRSTWNQAHDRVRLVIDINEGPMVRFGEIVIRGNFKTLPRVILKDLPFHPGDPFDYTKLDEGERNLQTHLIFTSARVIPLVSDVATTDVEDLRNPVPVVVTVQERYLERFGSLAVAAGLATDKLPNYAYVSAGWLWSNFFGLGSQLELRADFGFTFTPPYVWGASVRYTDVRAFGPGWRFDFAGFYRSEVTNRFGPVSTYGASAALTRYFGTELRIYLRYDNYLAQVSVPFLRTDGPHDIPQLNDNTHTAKFTLGVAWDRRIGADGVPNPLAPVRGFLLAASAGWAFPSSVDTAFVNFWSSEHDFFVLSGQALGLLPFKIRSAEFTLIGNLRFDEGFPIGEPALPVVERFFAGGDTTTRGYDPDTLKSEIVRADVSPLSGQQGFRVIPEGGSVRVLSTVELQFPIAKTFIGLPFPWVGALFWDVGAVIAAPELVQGSDFRHAIGLSLLRILTPVGPLSLEYAYPLTQTVAEERWKTNPWYTHFPGRIHFNWGIPLSRL